MSSTQLSEETVSILGRRNFNFLIGDIKHNLERQFSDLQSKRFSSDYFKTFFF